ncbi:TIGR03086 family metal-binding protein [Dactylosporangium sp. NPDC005555]|uniref:TIGR03086 family metal-binding protein n=1 Tax=Dactylosporangium sp. NPDC005555 TaxID=3154889 RepID=UPI0033B2BEC5
MSANTWTVLDESHAALRAVLAGLRPSDLPLATPCERWNVTQVLQHAAGDQLGFAASITGEGWPAFDPFSPSGELDGDFEAFVAFVEATMRASAAAWATVASDATEAPTPLPQGKMAGWLGAGACGLDAAVHAWDVAVATGQPSPLSDALAERLLPVAREIVEPLRAYGAYAPALPSGDAGGPAVTLLRYLGRAA